MYRLYSYDGPYPSEVPCRECGEFTEDPSEVIDVQDPDTLHTFPEVVCASCDDHECFGCGGRTEEVPELRGAGTPGEWFCGGCWDYFFSVDGPEFPEGDEPIEWADAPEVKRWPR